MWSVGTNVRDAVRRTVRETPVHPSGGRAARARAGVAAAFVAAAATLSLTAAIPTFANPIGPQVRGGSATITSAGPVMTVTSSQGAMIDWQGFSVGAGETVRFVQPEGSTVINRVTGGSMEFGGSVQTSGRVLFLNGPTVSGTGVSGDLGVMTAASLRNSALAPPTGVQPRDLAARAAQALKQGKAFVIGPRGTTLTAAHDSNVLLVAGRGAELGDRRLPFVRVLVVAPADKPLDLDALVAARPNGIFQALFLPATPASATRGEAPTALAGLADVEPVGSAAVLPAIALTTAQPDAVAPRAVEMAVVELPAVEPVVVELRVATLAGLPEQRVLTAELSPVEDRVGAPVIRAPAPIEERVIIVWAAPVEDRAPTVVARPEAPVEERLMVAVLREPAPVEERVAAELLRPAAPVEERVMLAVLRDDVRAAPVTAKPATATTGAMLPAATSPLSVRPEALRARQWALKEIANSTPVPVAVSKSVPALVQVAAQTHGDRQPVKLASIQRRMPRILIDYRGAVFHM